MILYQALSSYQILECMVHRQIFHKNKKCILILGTYVVERMPQYRELVIQHFFDEVYLFRFGGYKGSEDEIMHQVEGEIRRTLPYNLEDFEKILVAGIHTYLQMFLIHKNISFEMFEDGSGALSRPHILSDIHKKSAPFRYKLIEKYGLYDHSNELITKKYCDMKSQKPGFFDEKAEDFQVMEEFYRLTPKIRDEIRRIFRIRKQKVQKECVLLLTQQFANLGQLTLDGQIEIYRHLFDYYLSGNLVLIKPHPDDILYYSLLFPGVEILEGAFPSELLPLAFDVFPETLCTVSSTGVNQISSYFKKHIIFNAMYEESYIYDSFIFTALKLGVYLGAEQILAEGINIIQLRNMAQSTQSNSKIIKRIVTVEEANNQKVERTIKTFTICGDKSSKIPEDIENISGLGVLCLNESQAFPTYLCMEKNKVANIIPIVVREGNQKYTMYFYSKRKEVRNLVKQFEMSKELVCQKERISVEKLTDDQLYIQMLEGILSATERRLLEYIQSEKELKKKLQKLQEKEKLDEFES